jgi:hypothetical protein
VLKEGCFQRPIALAPSDLNLWSVQPMPSCQRRKGIGLHAVLSHGWEHTIRDSGHTATMPC